MAIYCYRGVKSLLFGYIKANKPNLLVKEYEVYKSIYCTLCRELGHSYGVLARFTLSYDFVFLALILMNSSDQCATLKKGRCPFNPLAKCGKICSKDNCIEYAAATALIMQYYKVKDNIEDSKGIKKIPHYLILPIFSLARKKAKKNYPELEEISKNASFYQRKVEIDQVTSIDKACDPTASSLSKIFSLNIQDQKQKRILDRIGYCIGKWVYLIDAVDDIYKDAKNNTFNPFLLQNKNDIDIDTILHNAEMQLNSCISEACTIFDLSDKQKFNSIIKNILYEGLASVQDEVFKKIKEGIIKK